MIYGLPWTSWLLLVVAVGLGLGISMAFYRAHRGEVAKERTDVGETATPGPGVD